MLIYEALQIDHNKLKSLLNRLIELDEEDSEDVDDLIQEIRSELVPHSRAEEAVLYNSIRTAAPDAKAMIRHAFNEHLEAETLLRALQGKSKIDLNWRSTAIKLKEVLIEHILEEEGRVFSVAKSIFSDDEAAMMTGAFERLKEEVRDESVLSTTLEMIANMMPPRFARTLGKFNLRSRLNHS